MMCPLSESTSPWKQQTSPLISWPAWTLSLQFTKYQQRLCPNEFFLFLFFFFCNSTYSLYPEHWIIQEPVNVLHLFTCHGRIMPRLAELLFTELSACNKIVAEYYFLTFLFKSSMVRVRPSQGVPVPLFTWKKLAFSLVSQNENLDFLCSLFPKITFVPLFPSV